MKVWSQVSSFHGGEFSPEVQNRVDLRIYAYGCRNLTNMIANVPGGVQRRPGTRYVADLGNVLSSPAEPFLASFRFSRSQSYVLGFTAAVITDKERIQGKMTTYQDAGVGASSHFEALPIFFEKKGGQIRQSKDYLFMNYDVMVSRGENHVFAVQRDARATSTPTPKHRPPRRFLNGGTSNITGAQFEAGAGDMLQMKLGRFLHPSHWSESIWLLVEINSITGPKRKYTFRAQVSREGQIARIFTFPKSASTQREFYRLSMRAKHWHREIGRLFWRDYRIDVVWLEVRHAAGGTPAVINEMLQVDDTPWYCQTTHQGRRWWVARDFQLQSTDAGELFKRTDLKTLTDQHVTTRRGYTRAEEAVIVQELRSEHRDVEVDAAINLKFGGSYQDTPVSMFGGEQFILFTEGAEHVIRGSSANAAITPFNVQIRQISSYGSDPVVPVEVGNMHLFVRAGGRGVMEFRPYTENEGYQLREISIFAQNLLENGVVRMAYQGADDKILWCVTKTGGLIGCTYDPAEKVAGWHKHDLGGRIVDIATIPGQDVGKEETWVIVERGGRYSLEVMQETDHHMDCFMEFPAPSSPKKVIEGFPAALEGAKVTGWAEGAEIGEYVVSRGSITLDKPLATAAVFGLVHAAEFSPLPQTPQLVQEKLGIGAYRSVTELAVKFRDSSPPVVFVNGERSDDLKRVQTSKTLEEATPIRLDGFTRVGVPSHGPTPDEKIVFTLDTPGKLAIESIKVENDYGE